MKKKFSFILLVMKSIYLDWAATAPPDPEIIHKSAQVAIDYYGNPSSLHRQGVSALYLLEEARVILGQIMDCEKQELIFTSGATEANNMIVNSLLKRMSAFSKTAQKPGIVISGLEHASLWKPVQFLKKLGFQISVVNPQENGIVKAEKIYNALHKNTVLVILMLLNNEIGAIQRIKQAVNLVRDFSENNGRRILFHTDAVQALGKIPLSLKSLGVDSACFSAHKLGGPRGAGALYVKKDTILDFLYKGGSQEAERRPGTENLAAIYGFAQVLKKIAEQISSNLVQANELMDRFIKDLLKCPGISLVPENRYEQNQAQFSPFILNITIPPIPGELLVRVLDDYGICVSTGSACYSIKKKRTRVLTGMGLSEEKANSAIRISIGPDTKEEDLEFFVSILKRVIPQLKKGSAFNKS